MLQKHRKSFKKYIVYAVIALILAAFQQLSGELDSLWNRSADGRLLEAWKGQESKVWVTVDAEVVKNLPDDLKGDRHQRFLINAGIGPTVLVAHNIDLADRVPVSRGQEITLSGRYEWNEKGGVIHWTHHDPSGRREGGWIEVEGRKYR